MTQAANRALTVVPLTIKEANRFIKRHHRHHQPVHGALFAIGCEKAGELCGVVVVGRPVARMRDDGWTAEVTRLATDGTKNACSMLYGAAARTAFQMGYRRIGTYIYSTEPGTSLKASGWTFCGERKRSVNKASQWAGHSRPGRNDAHAYMDKQLWELVRPDYEGLAPRSRIPEKEPMPAEQGALAV